MTEEEYKAYEKKYLFRYNPACPFCGKKLDPYAYANDNEWYDLDEDEEKPDLEITCRECGVELIVTVQKNVSVTYDICEAKVREKKDE